MWMLAVRFMSIATVQGARLWPPQRNYSTQTEDSEGIGTAEREKQEEETERRVHLERQFSRWGKQHGDATLIKSTECG